MNLKKLTHIKDAREKAYINYMGNISDPLEVADWLYSYVKRMFKMDGTLNPDQTIQICKAFAKRYELDSWTDSERYIKGLFYNREVSSKYSVALDTNFGLYNFHIEKK